MEAAQEGGSLAQKLAGTPQPAAQAASVLITLATAANVAHLGGIIHRDLKPSNILLTADGTPKVADFGLARRVVQDAAITEIGAHVGTSSYMAPEQATGKPTMIGPSSDIDSLGAILYEMLTGWPPFRGETAAETEHQVIHDDPVPPSGLNHKVPRDLETICLKCLRKEPDRVVARGTSALPGRLLDQLPARPLIGTRTPAGGRRLFSGGRRRAPQQ